MSDPSPSPRAASLAPETGHKQRKLRKGTHSCWECKRRKIRCVFDPSDDETCISCRRRGTACAGQEQPETLPSTREYHQTIGEGIAKVQTLLCDRASKIKAEAQDATRTEAPAFWDTPPETNFPTSPSNGGTPLCLSNSEEAISAALIAALPCRRDMEIFLQASRKVSYFCQMMNVDWKDMMSREEIDAPSMKTPDNPTAKTHPVVIARLMLGCAVFLQNTADHRHCTFSESPQAIKERLAAAAIRLATANSELHGSLDCIECIMMEALFHTHTWETCAGPGRSIAQPSRRPS